MLDERARAERADAFDPYGLTAHLPSYLMPFYATSDVNDGAYRDLPATRDEGFEPVELQFQLSLKAALNDDDLVLEGDSLWFAMTLAAWWQVYDAALSRPFRETNYMPELFYRTPLGWHPFGGNTAAVLGLVHQSNGRGAELSRGWNRVYAGLVYENGGLVLRLRPWYRIPETGKRFPGDPRGDDNPDILDYMGHGDLTAYLRAAVRTSTRRSPGLTWRPATVRCV